MSDSPPLEPLPDTATRLNRHGVAIAFLALPLAMAVGLACLGLAPDDTAISAVAAVLYTWFTSGAIAVGFVLAAVGYGWPVVRLLVKGGEGGGWDRLFLQPAAGLAALLFVDHLVGMVGGLSGSVGRIGAGLVLAVGIGLLIVQGTRTLKSRPRLPRAPWTALLSTASVAVLLVAAANPPGVLWRSEAGGFDALSYHLPLAQEWATGTRLWPLSHNVYSFLPSYAEAGFTQVAALTGGRLVANDGVGVLACQFVHVGEAFIAAFTVGALAAALARRCGAGGHGAWIGGGLGFAVVLSVPWTVVTGSLAYNEMPALALLAGAALAAVSEGSVVQRGLGAGLLLGASAACKPTFLLIGGPTVGLVLLATIPWRQWHKVLIAGAVGGLVMLAPPLARNWVACGNPLFPLSMAMGKAHWNDEQAARFKKAHGREGTIGEQVKLLLAPEPDHDPRTGRPMTFDGEARGIFHGQWAMMFPVGIAAMGLLMLRSQTRRVGAVLAGGVLGGWAFWVVMTHGQSRFLMPLLPNLACGLGVLAAWLLGASEEGDHVPPLRRLSMIFCCVMPLLASAGAARLFLTENHGRPNEALTLGVSQFTGESLAERFAKLPLKQRQEIEDTANPPVYTAVTFDADINDKLFLLGDATPLYYLCPVIYNTTWDRSVLGLAMEQHPDEPAAWTRAVQQTGATYILINHAEIERYRSTYGFDPAITRERLETWMLTLGEPTRVWNNARSQKVIELYEVPADKPAPKPSRTKPATAPSSPLIKVRA